MLRAGYRYRYLKRELLLTAQKPVDGAKMHWDKRQKGNVKIIFVKTISGSHHEGFP